MLVTPGSEGVNIAVKLSGKVLNIILLNQVNFYSWL